MKFSFGFLPLLLAICENNVSAFAPTSMTGRQSTARSLIDPSNLHELPHHIQSLQDVMSTFSIADLDSAGLPITGDVAAAVPVADVAAAAEEVAKTDNGWFGFLTGPIMAFLQLIHTGIVAVGLDSNSWGVSIITLTLTIKLLTYPITKQQLESTQKMQVRTYYSFRSCLSRRDEEAILCLLFRFLTRFLFMGSFHRLCNHNSRKSKPNTRATPRS